MAATKTSTEATTVELTMGEALNRALAEAIEREPEMMLLGQDMGVHGGTFGVTRGLYERFGEDVVRDGPLCESATVGFGIGLAISGVRAVVEIEFFDFIGVAMDQVFNQAAKLHYFTGGKLSVPLVIRTPIVARGWAWARSTRRASRAWFMHIPGLKIAMPADAADAYGLLRTALLDPNPVLMIENVRAVRPPRPTSTSAVRSRSGKPGSCARGRTRPSSPSRAWSTRRWRRPTRSPSAASRSR